VLIDCAEADFERGLEFWSRALGKEILEADGPRYRALRGRVGGEGGPFIVMQRVSERERAIHLDIETDDVGAEVARLEKLGARVKARIQRHVVMEAPSGHAFCVVPEHRGDFPGKARRWDEEP
jgi:predicted enzyme related to lactoylglutathione lyase